MVISFLLKEARTRGFLPRVQQTPQAQEYGALHGVDPYNLQNNMGAALQQLTQNVMGQGGRIKNPIYAQMMQEPVVSKPAKKSKKNEDVPELTPYELGLGTQGALDAFARAHSIGKLEGKGEKVLSMYKNKDFTHLTAPGTGGQGNPEHRNA